MNISVLIDKQFQAELDADRLKSIMERVLGAEAAGPETEVGLLITTQAKVHRLNRTFRGKDAPTDVLSFQMTPETSDESSTFVTPPDGITRLGEVIISYPQAELQAKEDGHSVQRELTILVTHGVLHLLGYDHKKPADKRRMRAREKEILGQIAD